jgi:hypothetical protein
MKSTVMKHEDFEQSSQKLTSEDALLPYPGASSAPGRKRKNPDTKGG